MQAVLRADAESVFLNVKLRSKNQGRVDLLGGAFGPACSGVDFEVGLVVEVGVLAVDDGSAVSDGERAGTELFVARAEAFLGVDRRLHRIQVLQPLQLREGRAWISQHPRRRNYVYSNLRG